MPEPISRRTLKEYLSDYYGEDKSLLLEGVPIDHIVVCNLSDTQSGDWAHKPPTGKIGIDPELGRIAFAKDQLQPPRVTFHYGFSADMGGGEYDRSDTFDPKLTMVESVPAPAPHNPERLRCSRLGRSGGNLGQRELCGNPSD